MFYFVKTPKFLHVLFEHAVWFLPNAENKIYLTFDDGPVNEITPRCLDILKEFKVKATFFCVGENVVKNREIYQRIIDEGHAVGNHSFNHIKGWNTSNEVYFENIAQCKEHIDSNLFRPPYGKAKRSQMANLKKDYKIIMWDVLSGDFDPRTSTTKVIENVVENTEAGSIIVMHDNEKCGHKMMEALPVIIEKLIEKGFEFDVCG